MTHYRPGSKLPQSYEEEYGDDDDLDEDDVDGYDCLSDYDDDLEYTEGSEKRESYGRSQHCCDDTGNSKSGGRNADLRRHRSISEGCPRVAEPTDDNRRDHHNHLERKRRASIKGSYSDLREAIPGLRGSKASRAVTLQRAVEYIEELHRRNREHTLCVDTLTRQNEALDRQIQDLSRDCQLIDEDEYATVTAFGRGPNTAGPPASFGQAASFSSAGGSANGTGGFNVRFVASTAQPVNSNSGSSATSPSGGSSTGCPVVRVFAQDSPSTDASTSNSSAIAPANPGVAQLSYAALQVQQPQAVSATSTTAVGSTAIAQNVVPANSTTTTPSLARFIPPQTTTATESVGNGSSCRPSVPITSVSVSVASLGQQRARVLPTVASTTVSSSSASSTMASVKTIKYASPIVVVTQQSSVGRRIAATHQQSQQCAASGGGDHETPTAPVAVATLGSFPLETAVMKARSCVRVAPGAVPAEPLVTAAETLATTSAGTPPAVTASRRVVVVSAQDPPTSSTS
ncbi:hypothetical protein SprV_0301230600 [Sparganum proliferum]